MDWKGALIGVAVFVGLQLLQFVTSILANSSTPIAVRFASLAHTAWSDRKRQAAIGDLVRVVEAQEHPSKILGRTVTLGFFSAIFFAMPSAFSTLLDVTPSGNTELLGFSIPNHIPDQKFYMYLYSLCIIMATLSFSQLTKALRYLTGPRGVSKQALKSLAKLGVAEDEAWAEARLKHEKLAFRVPTTPT